MEIEKLKKTMKFPDYFCKYKGKELFNILLGNEIEVGERRIYSLLHKKGKKRVCMVQGR
jgi:hypothetical protein